MTQQPDKDVATALQSAGLGTMSQTPGPQTLAWGPPLDPTEPGAAGIALWVFVTGGREPVPHIDGGRTGDYAPDIQVRVRSGADAWEAGQALARAVRDALHCKPPAGYYDLRAASSEPFFLGQDDSGFFEWSVTFTIAWAT